MSNLEKFPGLKSGQVALMRADINTGIVLDDQYHYATTPMQHVYTVYASSEEGLRSAKAIVIERGNVECVLYDEGEKLLYYITPQNVDSH
jgi:hypothetical protein